MRLPRLLAPAALLLACPAPDPVTPPASSAELVCDRDYLPALRAMIDGARESVAAAQWELFEGTATDEVVALLGEAAGRGVPTRVMLDDSLEENAAAVERLRDLGVDARLDEADDKLHAKLVLADGVALAGSTNWSTSAIDWNRECNLRLTGAPAAYLAAWYEEVWADPGRRAEPDVSPGDGTTTALGDDTLLPALLARIEGAGERLDFTLYATFLQPDDLDEPAMLVFGALAEAAARGVAVRGVADFSDWNPDNSARNDEAVEWLRARGVEMRWDEPEVNLHAKVFLADAVAQVQSANVSSSGFLWNHEVGAWTTEPEVVADLEVWFDELWAASTQERPW